MPRRNALPLMASNKDYLWMHLQEVPPFRAIVRAVESRFYAQAGEIENPVLDMGCGDGHFAMVTFDQSFAVGIDPDARSIAEARVRNKHILLIQGDATKLPFADGEFASVVSNCVLEHIPDLDGVLREVNRVLQPGGRFIFSVPSHLFGEMLLGSTFLKALHLKTMANAYEVYFNKISKHYHTDDPQTWLARLNQHGFKCVFHSYYLNAQAHRAFDIAHYISIHCLLSRKITGRWTSLTPGFINRMYASWLRPFYESSNDGLGPYLFFITERDKE